MAYTRLDDAFGVGVHVVRPFETDGIGPDTFGSPYVTARLNSLAPQPYDAVRLNFMSTLAPSATVPGNVPLLTPRQIQAGSPWTLPPPSAGGCDKPPLSALLIGFRGADFGLPLPQYSERVATYPMRSTW